MKDQVMDVVGPVWQDLKAKKLWPVALVLLVAIVAVPVVLSTSSSAPASGASGSQRTQLPTSGLPVVSQHSGSGGGGPKGSARNPFAPQPGTGGGATTAATPASSSTPGQSPSSTSPSGGAGTSPTTGGGSTGQSTTGGAPGTTTTPSGPGGPVPSGKKPTPTTASLSPTQSYAVSLAMTNSHGGVDTTDPLERLSVLPSQHQPLLVELGVLKGGTRVLFAVQHGAFVRGPGTCLPGPIDCQIVSLAQDQTESMGIQTTSGPVTETMFAVTGIRAVGHGSKSAAMRARQAESSTGRSILNHSSLAALSLFRYEPNLGAVVDLRNLTVGGS